ncbi:MAG TPA: hypothetical protein VFK48_13330 [Usitatibacter sp.]|nr:hypothetical protein [Usitatibacter sp.]
MATVIFSGMEAEVAWYRVVFWQEDPNVRPSDVEAFVRDYCHSFRTAGLKIPAAFERRSEGARTFFLNPLAAAFYFNGPYRSERATALLSKGLARPCITAPDVSACFPVTCQAG